MPKETAAGGCTVAGSHPANAPAPGTACAIRGAVVAGHESHIPWMLRKSAPGNPGDAGPASLSKVAVLHRRRAAVGTAPHRGVPDPDRALLQLPRPGGLGAAFAAALLWLYAAVVCRLVRRRPVPPLLVLGVIGITVSTAVAVASGSSFLYFAQPILWSS